MIMEGARFVPRIVDELLEWHHGLLVHVKNVHRDQEGNVWVRGDAPVKLPILVFNEENWLIVANRPRPDGVLHLSASPCSSVGVVAWKNMTFVRPQGTTWTLAEFTAQS